MRFFKFLIFCCIAAAPAAGHEFWIEPQEYQVQSGGTVVADLKNGENFRGSRLAWFDRRTVRAEARVGEAVDILDGRAGDLPAITYTPQRDGLFQIIYQTTLDTITYRDPKKWLAFVKHKDLDVGVISADYYPFKEGYSRFVKTLTAVGDAKGEDSATGLTIELTALTNPYNLNGKTSIDVRLDYEGASQADKQVEIFEMAPDGAVFVTTTRTNSSGIATIPVKPGHRYLLDSVYLRRPAPDLAKERDILWETLWAALTFEVPQ